MSKILLDIVLSEEEAVCNFHFASFPNTMLAISKSTRFCMTSKNGIHSFPAWRAAKWE